MAKYINLQVPDGCSRDWNEMKPCDQARFCLSCQKNVMDFTRMTDQELVRFFKKQQQPVCGRFTQDQLNRDIAMPEKKISWLKIFLLIYNSALLLFLKSGAQNIIKAPVEMVPTNNVVGKVIKEATPSVTVNGMVVDEKGVPLPGASVIIKGGNQGVATDRAGRFQLSGVAISAILVVQYIGYDPQEFQVQENQKEVVIHLSLNRATLGEVVVAGYTIARKKSGYKGREKETAAKSTAVAPVFQLYPNPVLPSAGLHLRWEKVEPGSYVAEVFTENGELVQSQKFIIDKGNAETVLALNAFGTGSYFLKLTHLKNGRHSSQQFRIQP